MTGPRQQGLRFAPERIHQNGWGARYGLLGLCVLVFSAALVFGEPVEASDQTRIKWHDCDMYDGRHARALRCGHAFIGDPITAILPFVVIQSSKAAPSHSAILFLQGGPGMSSGLDPLEFTWSSWADEAQLPHDLIVFDQRGTGASHRQLSCFEMYEVVRPALAAGMFSRRSWELFDDAKAACHDALVASGFDAAQFTVRRMVDDARALMEALPYSDWTVWGSSYGSRIALEVMRGQPAGLRSVVLDGVVPPDLNLWLEEPVLLDRAIATIDRVCPRWRMERQQCQRYAGDFTAGLESVLEEIAETPRWLSIDDWSGQNPYKVRVDPPVLLYTLVAAVSTTDGANLARDAVIDAAHGDYRLLDMLMQSWARGQTIFDINEATYFSVACNFNGVSTEEDFAQRVPAAQFYDRYIAVPPYTHPCVNWTVSRAPDVMRQPVVSTIPTLLISGEYDPITPSIWGDRVAATLDHSYHFVVRRGGHSVLYEDACAMRIFRSFLIDPSTEPDSVCLHDRMPGIRDEP